MVQELFILVPFLLLLTGNIVLSFKTRFVQLRTIPRMINLLKKSLLSTEHNPYTIKAHKALFTAMSTTIGIGNIVGPLIAIGLGGPGAVIGYILATFFGSAATFTEVTFALKYKDPAPLGKRVGGPMHYLNLVFPKIIGYIYAAAGFTMLIVWSGAQSNAIAAILAPYNFPPVLTGAALAGFTIFVLMGGIKRVGNVAETMVPIMFVVYSLSMLWILLCNASQILPTLALIFRSAFKPTAVAGGVTTAGLVQALRWGLAKGYQSNEAGIGTATIPHSKSNTKSPVDQGILSIISVYSNGILCLLSALAILTTGFYNNYGLDNITIITKLFSHYFPFVGPIILLTSMMLFVISTIIGNSYNGSQLFLYVLGKRGLYVYYLVCALSIFLSSMFSVEAIWTLADILTAPVIVPHIIGIVLLAFTRPQDLLIHDKQ